MAGCGELPQQLAITRDNSAWLGVTRYNSPWLSSKSRAVQNFEHVPNFHWLDGTRGELSNAVVTSRRTCKCVLSTCKNVGKIWVSVRGEYRLRTDLGARRHTVALLVHEELSLRSGCVRATPVCVTCVPGTANERTTPWLRASFKGARDKCVVRAYSPLPQFSYPMSTQNSRAPYRVSTYNARCSHWFMQYIVSSVEWAASWGSNSWDFWRTSECRPIYTPSSSHVHAFTTCEWVRTPYVSSTCKYDLRAITWQPHGDRTL